MALARSISIVEVGPRDGLQNEPNILSTEDKLCLIEGLVDAGLKWVEVGSFVSPRHVPQMADSAEVLKGLHRRAGVSYSVLVPNRKGFELARIAGAEAVAIFASSSETFSQHNIGCSIRESLDRYREVVSLARSDGMTVRGYVSCVLGCPHEGTVLPEKTLQITGELLEMGCYEVSLGDTIGSGTPATVDELLATILKQMPAERLAVHFHDTQGQALANIRLALEASIQVVDSSIGGIGGCPFAPGSPGNISTESVISMCTAMGLETGVDPDKLSAVRSTLMRKLGKADRERAGASCLE